MTHPNEANTTLLVLCGGEGRRMGGRDKPLMRWHDRPMVDHVLASVPKTMQRLISANRNLHIYSELAPVVEDRAAKLPVHSKSGPLTGVLAGLRVCTTDWLLVAPGDAPALPENWWRQMMDTAAATKNHVVAHDGERQQHLHLLLHRSAVAALEEFLLSARFQVFLWLQDLQPATAQFNQPKAFVNLNYLRDLDQHTNAASDGDPDDAEAGS